MAGGSLQLCEYQTDVAPSADGLGNIKKRNLIDRYGADIRLPDLRWEISQLSSEARRTAG